VESFQRIIDLGHSRCDCRFVGTFALLFFDVVM
jgi:hypothetical protein